MAVIANVMRLQEERAHGTHEGLGTRVYSWLAVSESDTTTEVYAPTAAEKSVQVVGTFGSGAVPIEGSIDGTNYHTLFDVTDTAISPTAAGIYTIRDNVVYVRCGTPLGTSASVNVHLLIKEVS